MSNDAGDGSAASIRRCDYCRLPCPKTPVSLERDDVVYEFCSESCRDALEGSDRVFTEYHGFRRFNPKVAALEAGLPQGIPRNSFVMLSDLAGTRAEAIQAELVWRALQRGEPVVYVSFLEPPVSIVQKFVDLEWNVLPYLETGQLHIFDCFTYRVEDRERMIDRFDDWNEHLARVAEGATTTARDPTSTGELENQLDRCLERHGLEDSGIVLIDSLTEFGTLVQPVQAYDFVKNVRADVCKGRFVPVFAGATVTGNGDSFPHDLGYIVDGIVEMQLNDDIVEDALIKRIRVRKMSGVLTYPEWTAYEYTSGQGIVMFDPEEQIEAAEDEPSGDADDDSAAGTDEDATDAEEAPDATDADGAGTPVPSAESSDAEAGASADDETASDEEAASDDGGASDGA